MRQSRTVMSRKSALLSVPIFTAAEEELNVQSVTRMPSQGAWPVVLKQSASSPVSIRQPRTVTSVQPSMSRPSELTPFSRSDVMVTPSTRTFRQRSRWTFQPFDSFTWMSRRVTPSQSTKLMAVVQGATFRHLVR